MILKTVEEYATKTIVIEKSRFICELFYVESEIEAKKIINQIKENHPKAAHHCYAYIIKKEFQNIENQSDDGEPSKTAGLPMLDILRYENLINTLAVVTRYFGGTLLGTGGLIRAYSGAVKQTVDLAKIKTATLMRGYKILVSYSHHNMVEYELKKQDAIIKSIEYDEQVKLVFYTANSKTINFIQEKVNNQIEIEEIDSLYL